MKKKINKPKIALVASTDITISAFFRNHIKYLLKQYTVVVITNYKNNNFLKDVSDDINI